MDPLETAERPRLTGVQWLICGIAALGFAFDIYELLVMPLIARPALSELLGVDPDTDAGFQAILSWNSYIMWGSALCGGTFGLLGGYLTDLFGRRRILTWSIMLYAFSALAAGFSTSAPMLLVLRCTTFIGVCVEFVAAVAWLAELFPDPKQKEAALGYTQAFSSIGGLLVTVAYGICVKHSGSFPAIYDGHAAWRYTLISGVIPALPLIVIRPFLPESPVWQQKRAAGTLKRPSLNALFEPKFARTSVITALMFACSYGAAFGAIQFTPQIVPGLNKAWAPLPKLRAELGKAQPGSPEAEALRAKIKELDKDQQSVVKDVQLYQEFGGLLGRFALAWLAVRIVSRRKLLRIFLVPGMVLTPLVFCFPGAGKVPEALLGALGATNLDLMKAGIFAVGFMTVAQFSFWGNYLPRVYPVFLRGTGESFAANVGGRMVGTSANALTGLVFGPLFLASFTGMTRPGSLAYAAAATAAIVYVVGFAASFLLPEPEHDVERHDEDSAGVDH
jgi:MFS family permease